MAISVVRGLPGVGKSGLLRATGNDARIKAHFTGGVLYAELGPSPDLSQSLRRWIAALGHEPPRSDDAETLAGALRAALAPRRALLNNMALAYERTGRYEEAITTYEEVISVYRSLNTESELATALGNVYYQQRCYDEAIDHYQQSQEISRRIGNVVITGRQLGNLGVIYAEQGRYDEAITHCRQSLEIFQRISDLAGTASALGNLGVVYDNQGHYDEAIDHYQQSLEITRRIGDRATTANNTWNLGLLYEAQGDLAAALPLIEEAAQIAERIGMPGAAGWRVRLEELRARRGGGMVPLSR